MKNATLLLLMLITLKGSSQSNSDSTIKKDDALKIFLDCNYCDMDYLRSEISIVNYVRDRKEANVDIVASIMSTGSGGNQLTFVFIGQGRFKGQIDTLRTTITSFSTDDNTRNVIAQTLKIGLTRFIAQTPYACKLNVCFAKDSAQATNVNPTTDHWKSWVFTTFVGGSINQQQLTQQLQFTPALTITKITPDWKIILSGNGYYQNNTYNINGEIVKAITKTGNITADYVKSLGEHFSTGIVTTTIVSTPSNFNLQEKIGPGIEYSIFPYSECTHRQLRFFYSIYDVDNQYADTTIYGKIHQNLGGQSLTLYSQYKEKWGSLAAQITGENYLYDMSKYELNMTLSLNLSLFEGFSVSINSYANIIHDQIYLPAAGPTTNDILLGLQTLATTYQFGSGVTLTYTFGSIYNNTVNPRFTFLFPYN
jgi:hypothetical protein